ncbi:hypothetical protein SmJEL517_g04535 [Synchytrium microbalum]|uniref:ABC-2 type transporter transmembrane domain-containing protein n=1 Tax=Synchytrium microbalum TaxID=1806994 RepID=A0A507C354_9FUNG|nr:uncharacterized protein SmJEL517_g04535 [Synchytrium microbalum]TPX32376.1 hypothetical protein SmJEL517_g04535 [Synchytrium microbalum]
MSSGRFIGGIVIALFFGGAFFGLGDNYKAYGSKDSSIFALSFFPPLFGVASISYWLSIRKLYYQEVSSGFYNPLFAHFANYLTEIVFMSLVITLVVFIQLPMANFHRENWVFIWGMAVLQVFACTGYNIMCTNLSPSIPYANAFFNLLYYYSLIFDAYYVTDTFLFNSCSSCQNFWAWLGYGRSLWLASVRKEYVGYSLTCTQAEKLPINLEGLTKTAIANATVTLSLQLASGNKTLLGLAATNPTLFSSTIASLSSNAAISSAIGGVMTQSLTLAAAGVAQDPTFVPFLNATLTGLGTQFAVATGATSAAALSGYETIAYLIYIIQTLSANVAGFGLPDNSVCPASSGTTYLIGIGGATINDIYGIPDSFFQGNLVMLAMLGFTVGYFALICINYRQR